MPNFKYYDGSEWVDIGSGGGSGGTSNYNDLSNKPQINGNVLSGNKTATALGLASASHTHTTSEITDISTTYATKSYVDELVGDIETALDTLNSTMEAFG